MAAVTSKVVRDYKGATPYLAKVVVGDITIWQTAVASVEDGEQVNWDILRSFRNSHMMERIIR